MGTAYVQKSPMPNVLIHLRSLPLQVSKLITWVSFLILGYGAVQIVLIPMRIEGHVRSIRSAVISKPRPITLEPLETYLGPFTTHALFYMPKAAAAVAKGPSISERLAQFELTGIVQGVEPEALIQDRTC